MAIRNDKVAAPFITFDKWIAQFGNTTEQLHKYLDYINTHLGNTTGQFQSHLYPKQGAWTALKAKAASKTSGLRTAVTTTARQTPALMELYGRKKSIGGSPSVRE